MRRKKRPNEPKRAAGMKKTSKTRKMERPTRSEARLLTQSRNVAFSSWPVRKALQGQCETLLVEARSPVRIGLQGQCGTLLVPAHVPEPELGMAAVHRDCHHALGAGLPADMHSRATTSTGA
jgi:hypothetical protein